MIKLFIISIYITLYNPTPVYLDTQDIEAVTLDMYSSMDDMLCLVFKEITYGDKANIHYEMFNLLIERYQLDYGRPKRK